MRNVIIEAVELFHGNGLRVDDGDVCLVLVHLASLVQEGQGTG